MDPRMRMVAGGAPEAAIPAKVTVKQPLGKNYKGSTVDVQYVGGGELTLRSRAISNISYNFARGDAVRIAAEDASRFLNNHNFRRYNAPEAPAKEEPKAEASAPAKAEVAAPAKVEEAPAPADVPTFPTQSKAK